jgi:hypothetical protein
MKSRRGSLSKEQLLEYQQQGLSLSSIAGMLGISISKIKYWEIKHGIALERKVGLPLGYVFSPDALANRPSLCGELNPFFGKKHTKETTLRMSQNHADFTGDNNPYRRALIKHPEKRQAQSERSKKWWAQQSPEYKEARAQEMSKRSLSPSGSGRNHKNGYHNSNKVKSEKFWYRSSWEKTFAELLDADDRVLSYDVEQIVVQYKNQENKTRWTRMDFDVQLCSGHRIIVEIKPESVCIIKQEKLKAQLKWCVDNNVQYAIADKLVLNLYDALIDAAMENKFEPGTFNGYRTLAPQITLDILRSKS